MATKGKSPLFARLLRQSFANDEFAPRATVSAAFEAAFERLAIVQNRDEYIYKAALTHRVLLGTHSLRTASMLTEFRVGACKADLVILNGTSTAYEIKSERDSLSRLKNQLDAYRRVFARVYVIAGENHVDSVLSTADTEVGVMVLSPHCRIRTVREAVNRADRICPTTLFESLRLDEAQSIAKRLGYDVPTLPNMLMRAELRKMIVEVSPATLHAAFVATVKTTRSLASLDSFVNSLPASLHAVALTTPLKVSQRGNVLKAIHTSLHEATAWG